MNTEQISMKGEEDMERLSPQRSDPEILCDQHDSQTTFLHILLSSKLTQLFLRTWKRTIPYFNKGFVIL